MAKWLEEHMEAQRLQDVVCPDQHRQFTVVDSVFREYEEI